MGGWTGEGGQTGKQAQACVYEQTLPSTSLVFFRSTYSIIPAWPRFRSEPLLEIVIVGIAYKLVFLLQCLTQTVPKVISPLFLREREAGAGRTYFGSEISLSEF